MTKSIAFVLFIAACGGGGGSGGDDGVTTHHDGGPGDGEGVIDAPVDASLVDAPDAPPDAFQSVLAVTCDDTEVGTVSTEGMSTAAFYTYDGLTTPFTINVDDVVKFVMPGGTNHDVAPDPTTTTDPGLRVGFAQTKCLKFTMAGTFGFKCSVHSFKGSITVQ